MDVAAIVDLSRSVGLIICILRNSLIWICRAIRQDDIGEQVKVDVVLRQIRVSIEEAERRDASLTPLWLVDVLPA